VTSVISTTSAPMTSEFVIHCTKRVCSNRYSTLANVGGALNQNGLLVGL
jgi:hypothetical protein